MSFLLASLILIIPLVEIWILIQIGIAASLNAVLILCVISGCLLYTSDAADE